MGRRRASQPSTPFGLFLDQHLEHLNLTPAAFAERAGLSVSHVYQLLRGDRPDPRGTTLRKIATALGLPADQLSATPISTPTKRGTPVDKATFFALMSAFPTGVTVVATIDELGQPRGLTCTAVCSLSAEPPLLLVCIDKRSNTLAALRHTRGFVVNYLLAGRGELSNHFATRGPDKFLHTPWRPTRAGLPWLYADSLAYAECGVIGEVDGGDHVIFIGRVDGGQTPAPGTQPLTYFRRSYVSWRS